MASYPIPTHLFINGESNDSVSAERFPIYSPVDDSLVSDQVQYAVEEDVNRAVQSAQTAFRSKEWATISAKERGRILLNIAKVLREKQDELVWLD